MNIFDVMTVISFAVTLVTFGYMIGKDLNTHNDVRKRK